MLFILYLTLNTMHAIFENILKPFAPPILAGSAVRRTSHSDGRIHTSEFRGADSDVVFRAAEDFIRHIEPMASPAMKLRMWDGDEYVVEVRYYTVD